MVNRSIEEGLVDVVIFVAGGVANAAISRGFDASVDAVVSKFKKEVSRRRD